LKIVIPAPLLTAEWPPKAGIQLLI